MAAFGPLGIGLSIVLGGFALVLLAEIYYVFFWKKYDILQRRVSRIGTEYCSERGDFAHEAALVGSFGGYSESSVETQFLAKLFPVGPETTCNNNLYMHGVFRSPSILFTIKEETKEDMEFEKSVKHKDEGANKNASFLPDTQPLQFLSSEPPSPKQKQHQLSQFPYSLGLIQQPQLFRSMSTKTISHQGLLASVEQNILRVPSDLSRSSCSVPSSPVHRSSSTSPSRLTSESVSPSICSRPTSPKHQASRTGSPEQVFSWSECNSSEIYCVSNPMYEVDNNKFQCVECSPSAKDVETCPKENETPFCTPVSSPSLLTPPSTPPLTSIKTSQDPHAFFKRVGRHRSETGSIFSSPESSPSFSSSKCSFPLESFHKTASVRQSQGPPGSPSVERRALMNTLARESPCFYGLARPASASASNCSSNASSPFTTAPSTPYFTWSNQCPSTNPHESIVEQESFCMV